MTDAAPLIPLASPAGEVITFYSYKGGTGRSMAMANVACLLAGEGASPWKCRVLMIDWDLEAPGLHRFFRGSFGGLLHEGPDSEELDDRPGLLELLSDLKKQVYASTSVDSIQNQDAADKLLQSVDVKPWILRTSNPRLSLMKAGGQGLSYGQSVSAFDWEGLFKRSPWFFRSFVDRLAREYDYVLIDSRTGETDASGICTRILPQKLVVVFTPNRQSLTGVDRLVRKAVAYRRGSEDPRPLAVFPLASRVDSTYPTLVSSWRDGNTALNLDGYRWRFESLLKEVYQLEICDLGEYFKEVELQYIPEYAFGEEIAVRADHGGGRLSFAKSYETFATWLIERAGPWEDSKVLQERAERDAQRQASRSAADEAFSQLTPEEPVAAQRVLLRLVLLANADQRLRSRTAATTELSPGDEAVLGRLDTLKLVSVEAGKGTSAGTIRLADEELLKWARLRRWCQEERDFLLWRQGLDEAAARWVARGKPNDTSLLAAHLTQEAAAWRERRPADLNETELQFIAAMQVAHAAATSPLPPDERKAVDIARAKAILRGLDADIGEIEQLAKSLKNQQGFGYARKLFARARRHEKFSQLDAKRKLAIGHGHSLCTYKDPDLPAADRFTRALEILREIDNPNDSTNQETLGQAGAIYKRRWQVMGQRLDLERSLEFYRRGHTLGPANDQGWNSVNAAYMLELVALEEAKETRAAGGESLEAWERCLEARRIREDLVRVLPSLLDGPNAVNFRGLWWFCATVAEAYFGLGRYDSAIEWLRRGPPVSELTPWEFQSTFEQLGSLARLQGDLTEVIPRFGKLEPTPDLDRAQGALREFLGDLAPGVDRVLAGKVGLALSGGGFRASLFHIGVLAYLAERDILRHVEVLSCVSGGSIIGAHYYLEVQQLLRTTHDTEITQQNYVEIVRRIERDFLAGVQTNIRCQVLAEFWTNVRAAFWPNYTRTKRLGELYESRIFSFVRDPQNPHERVTKRYMRDLLCRPKEEKGQGNGSDHSKSAKHYNPKYDNWRRRNKVPVLILNATTLNTGHNWQFTATYMGEPPSQIDSEIDGNYRLRRVYYQDAPDEYRHVRLGDAVAASSCVPGLFEPLVMQGLYPDKTVRLVDGGVFDNQGVATLLEQDCAVMLVSDASGQMAATDKPSAGTLSVPLRAFSVSMARVRQAEYHELDARRRTSALRGLMFLHLKKDLDVNPIDWVECQDPHDASDDARPVDRRGVLTRYGIRKDVQERLAAIRTDLDSFSEVEAFALMTSGYRMAQREFKRTIEGFATPPQTQPQWRFLEIETLLGPERASPQVLKRLSVGSRVALKVWQLSKPLMVVGLMLAAALLGGLAWAVIKWRETPVVTVGQLVWSVLGFLAAFVVPPLAIRLLRYRETLGQFGLVTAGAVLVSVVFRFYLVFLDPIFLRLGRLSAVKKSASRSEKGSLT